MPPIALDLQLEVITIVVTGIMVIWTDPKCNHKGPYKTLNKEHL